MSNATYVKNRLRYVKRFFFILIVLVVISVASYLSYHFVVARIYNGASYFNLRNKWNNFDYQMSYDISAQILYKTPFDPTALMYHGYASYFLAISENDTEQAQFLFNEAINSLRLAILQASDKVVPQLEFMLGKAYFYKDVLSSSNYYSDLAVKYLLLAKSKGYAAVELPEILGLSYSALGMTNESISAFTEALNIRETDVLLLSIAEQYMASNQYSAAEQYLYRISKNCKDEKIILKTHYLLGKIYINKENYTEAENELLKVIEKNENFADAYYELGVIYEKQGDIAKARAEWRKSLRIEYNHIEAQKKLADYKQ